MTYKLKGNWEELMTETEQGRAGSIPDIKAELRFINLNILDATFTGTLDKDNDLEVDGLCIYIPLRLLDYDLL